MKNADLLIVQRIVQAGDRQGRIRLWQQWPKAGFQPRGRSADCRGSAPGDLVPELVETDVQERILVLVCPNRHIAFRDAADRPDRLAAYCQEMFGEPRATAL